MRLSDLLVNRANEPLVPIRDLSVPKLIERELEKIRRQWPQSKPDKSSQEADKLISELNRRHHTSDWTDYSWGDFIQAALLFIESDHSKNTNFSELRSLVIRRIHHAKNDRPSAEQFRRAYVRQVFHKYLETYDSNSSMTRGLADALSKSWQNVGLKIDTLVKEFQIFHTDGSPAGLLATYMVNENTSYSSLKNAGVQNPHSAGLMELAHEEFVTMLKNRIENGDDTATEKLIDWLNPKLADTTLQHQGANLAIAALLEPWRQSDPNKRQKEVIKNGLINAYGDPRTTAGIWGMCSMEARQVILKWLAGDTILMFFDIVTETEISHMWTDRKELWYGLFEEDLISEAWFALSKKGIEIAEQKKQEHNLKLEYGNNESLTAADRKKCLLIMKVNNRWVVEGSHSFKTHVFRKNDESFVEPYKDSYTCDQFRESSIDGLDQFVHWPIENWQNNVKKAIYK